MKEIKVKLYRGEDDYYVELWKVINHIKGEPQYYGRYTFNDEGTWYYVCDPLGYCELDRPVKDDVMFIICDENDNEYMRYSNADENRLLKFDTVMKNKWREFCENFRREHEIKFPCNTENQTANFWAEAINGETTLGINQWLLTFKDPDLYKKEIDEMYGYDENWTSCNQSREIAYETILNTEFEYIGHKFQFTKVTNKHDVCGAVWVEYLCTDAPYEMDDLPWIEDKSYIKNYGYLGNWFDKANVGTMYDKRTARQMVLAKVYDVFGKENQYKGLLYVNGRYCYKKSYSDVAEALINRDLHRKSVEDLILHFTERTEGIVFLHTNKNKQKIKEMYPDIYGYDWCLI